jgi:uncharacterized small protein (DUF1192 family)
MSVFRAAEAVGNTIKGNAELEKRVKALELEVARLRRMIERASKKPSQVVQEDDEGCKIS